ncbi:MAG: RidA family protein [Longimicrobiales bacterium]|jgi:isochorismate pyruvate lyase|nr:RidA family protein [Longimicrobiales bacterium]
MSFQRVFTEARWETDIGYCRALRADDRIFVTGTAPVNPDGSVHTPGDGYAQAIRCLEIMKAALDELGADFANVVRTRMFVTDISRWNEYGKAHAEVFGEHPPTTSMVEVRALIHPDMLIEIEADAIAPARE